MITFILIIVIVILATSFSSTTVVFASNCTMAFPDSPSFLLGNAVLLFISYSLLVVAIRDELYLSQYPGKLSQW